MLSCDSGFFRDANDLSVSWNAVKRICLFYEIGKRRSDRESRRMCSRSGRRDRLEDTGTPIGCRKQRIFQSRFVPGLGPLRGEPVLWLFIVFACRQRRFPVWRQTETDRKPAPPFAGRNLPDGIRIRFSRRRGPKPTFDCVTSTRVDSYPPRQECVEPRTRARKSKR